MAKKYASLETLRTFLDNLKETFSDLSHKHTLSDISDYKVDSTLSSSSVNPVQNKTINAEFDAISQAMGALETAIDSKANETHTHAISDVNELQIALDTLTTTVNGKSDSGHTHSASKITSGILAVERGGTGNMDGYVRAGQKEGSSIGALATAEGRNVTASGSYCHAEGNYTYATGSSSHAEGQSTEASGNFSHAEGESSKASGYASHAEGDHTIASGDYSHAQGKYNIEDTTGTYAHIIGNGESASVRSNAHTLDWNGNAWFAGDVYVGGTSQNNASPLISKADHEWVQIYDSGETTEQINAFANIDISGYRKLMVAVHCVNDTTNAPSTRYGSAIFKATNGTTYQLPVFNTMFSASATPSGTMAIFDILDGWISCPQAIRNVNYSDFLSDTEGGTCKNMNGMGGALMKCTNTLSTLTITSLDQNTDYYYGVGSRVIVWGCNA